MLHIHFHADCDGVVSAYFFVKELERLSIPYRLHPSLGASVKFTRGLNIGLDISDVKAEKKENLVIDHHITSRFNLFHVNPRFSGFEWPVSFLSYVLFGNESESWIAAVGVVADWCAEKVPKGFWEIVRSRYPSLVNSLKQEKLVKGPLGRMAFMIDSSIAVDRQDGAIYALEALRSAESPMEFLEGRGKAKRLKKLAEKIETEVEQVFGNELVTEKFVLLKFSSKYRIKSLVAARAREKYRKKLVVIAQEEGDKIRLSFRGGEGLDRLVKELTRGIGSGGGHEKASGGWVYREKWNEFRRRLFEKFK